MARIFQFALGAVLSGGALPAVLATTVRAPEFAELVSGSDYIVRAVVTKVTSEFAAPGSKKIRANFVWCQDTSFDASERLDPAVSGPNADAGGVDGGNLFEYALGFDPRTASTSGLPEVAASVTEWTYTYTCPRDVSTKFFPVEDFQLKP